MKPAQKDPASLSFKSVVVHYGSGKASFESTTLNLDGAFMSLPSAWPVKPLTEIELRLEVPSQVEGMTQDIRCLGMVIDCNAARKTIRPSKRACYMIDLYLTQVPSRTNPACCRLPVASNL